MAGRPKARESLIHQHWIYQKYLQLFLLVSPLWDVFTTHTQTAEKKPRISECNITYVSRIETADFAINLMHCEFLLNLINLILNLFVKAELMNK